MEGAGLTALSTMKVSLYVMSKNGIIGQDFIFTGYGIDTSLGLEFVVTRTLYGSYQAYPLNYGLRINESIDSIYEAANAMRWMPVYFTEGIGAFAEFTSDNSSPANLIFSNSSITFSTQWKHLEIRGRVESSGAIMGLCQT
jgi:hypothetical protein